VANCRRRELNTVPQVTVGSVDQSSRVLSGADTRQFTITHTGGSWSDSHVVSDKRIPRRKWKRVTASSSFAKVRGEVFASFHAVAVEGNSSMQN
jgi:hypothetical protein